MGIPEEVVDECSEEEGLKKSKDGVEEHEQEKETHARVKRTCDGEDSLGEGPGEGFLCGGITWILSQPLVPPRPDIRGRHCSYSELEGREEEGLRNK